MKSIKVNIRDESKFQLFINFLREVRFVEIEEVPSSYKIKNMKEVPQSMLHPVEVKDFKIYSRDELNDRKNFY